jgi:hypothetical protein
VYAEPRLADATIPPLTHVIVVARTRSQAETLAGKLRNEILGQRPDFFLESRHTIGEDHPEVPRIWGSSTQCQELKEASSARAVS